MSFLEEPSNFRRFDAHSLEVVIPPQDANFVNDATENFDIVMAVQDQDHLPYTIQVAILPYQSLAGEH